MYMFKTLKMLHNHLFYINCFMEIFRFLLNQNLHSILNQMHSLTPHFLPVQNLHSIPNQMHSLTPHFLPVQNLHSIPNQMHSLTSHFLLVQNLHFIPNQVHQNHMDLPTHIGIKHSVMQTHLHGINPCMSMVTFYRIS